MNLGLTFETYEEGERVGLADAMEVMDSAFDPAFGEAWTLAQLSGIMMLPGTWLTVARIEGDPAGFSLVRSVLDECELLLLAVDPKYRGNGIAKAMISDSVKVAKSRGIISMNLEVRANNTAIHLYEKSGFEFVHRRPSYYRGNDGQLYDALSFRLDMQY